MANTHGYPQTLVSKQVFKDATTRKNYPSNRSHNILSLENLNPIFSPFIPFSPLFFRPPPYPCGQSRAEARPVFLPLASLLLLPLTSQVFFLGWLLVLATVPVLVRCRHP
jgi:hypothetical protein